MKFSDWNPVRSAPKSETQLVGEQFDALLLELAEKPSCLFSVKHLMWLEYWINKPRWDGGLERERRLLAEAQELQRIVLENEAARKQAGRGFPGNEVGGAE